MRVADRQRITRLPMETGIGFRHENAVETDYQLGARRVLSAEREIMTSNHFFTVRVPRGPGEVPTPPPLNNAAEQS